MLHLVPAFSRIGEENAFAVLAKAAELQRQGRDIINLGIGQPDFKTPEHIVEAAIKALRDGEHGYTPATPGIAPLRRGRSRGPASALQRRRFARSRADHARRQDHLDCAGDPHVPGRPASTSSTPIPGFPIYRSMIE